VFTKLLVIIVLTGLCLHLVLGAFFWIYRLTAARPYQKTIYHYLSYLIDDMGNPPQPERAEAIARATALKIGFEGPHASWSTGGLTHRGAVRRLRAWSDYPYVRSGMIRRHFIVQVDRVQGKYFFEFSRAPGDAPQLAYWHIGLLAVVTLIMGGAYLLIRSVLKPLAQLKEGVHQVGSGHLTHRVAVNRKDEFRELAEAFNDMTARIRSMLHSKERLLVDVSHELRSPLTRVLVALELVPEGRAKGLIKADIEEMKDLVSTLLETARAHHAHTDLRLESVDLAGLVQGAVAEFAEQPPGVVCEQLPASLVCRGDPQKLKIVLRNVLANALKYSARDSAPVTVSLARKESCASVCVCDYGVGIAPDEIEAVFEPFYRVDKSRSRQTGGFGLGLSLCKTIMESHGGRIEISSTPGKGTRVCLLLQLSAAD